MQPDRKTVLPTAVAVGVGIALWMGASVLSGKREPWDASLYWTAAYPLALALSAALGFAFPDRPWRWALALFEGQFLGMVIRNGELGGLWPLGMALFGVLGLPALGAAQIAAAMRSRVRP